MQQAIYKSKRETGENETESNTYPHSESILSGPWVNLSLRCITLFWPPGGPNMMLISSSALLYILFSLPPNTQAVTEMRENIWGIIQSYMYGVYRLLAS